MFEVTPQTNDWPVMGKLIDFDENGDSDESSNISNNRYIPIGSLTFFEASANSREARKNTSITCWPICVELVILKMFQVSR